LRQVDRLETGSHAYVAQIEQHADPVHLLNRLHAEAGESSIGGFKATRCEGVALVVGELNDPYAEPVEHTDQVRVASEWAAALKSQDNPELAFALGAVQIVFPFDE